MDQFLALLPFLSFKGHNLNHTAAEGLAEALGVCKKYILYIHFVNQFHDLTYMNLGLCRCSQERE